MVADREGSVYLQIIHNRVVRQLATDYKIFPSEWNDKRSAIVIVANSERKSRLQSIRSLIRWDMERLTKICNRLEAEGVEFSADDIIDEFNRYADEYLLFNFMESIIAKLKHNGKVRTAETYRATLNSFKRFRDNEDIMLDCITAETMESYEVWLRNRGLIPNSISFYTRILRAVYNRAVEQDVIENRNPFRHVYTGIDKTVKRALPLAVIKRIKAIDLSLQPQLDYARDIFMLSFYLRGMSFIDMAFLKKSDLRNGYVTYHLAKPVKSSPNPKTTRSNTALTAQTLSIHFTSVAKNSLKAIIFISKGFCNPKKTCKFAFTSELQSFKSSPNALNEY